MASDDEFKRLYLFGTAKGCCMQWFLDWGAEECEQSIVQGHYDVQPCPENRPECNHVASVTDPVDKWYPDIDANQCKKDRAMPQFMLEEGYMIWYLFNTEEQCETAFGFG